MCIRDRDNTDGKNADYIPYLTNIDPKLFGISICLMNGEIIQLGDSQYRFGFESVSKVLTAILVLRQYGAPKVLEIDVYKRQSQHTSLAGADSQCSGFPFCLFGRIPQISHDIDTFGIHHCDTRIFLSLIHI